MTIYYGFEMDGLSWRAFTLSAMADRRWYLRRQRIAMYTITMMVGMAAQCAATFCMFKYEFLQNHIEAFTMHQAHVHNNDIVAAGITSMVIPCIALLLFTVEYFLLVLWPGKLYSRAYNRWKGGIFVAACVGMLATAVVSTIFVATRSASISGVDATAAQQLTSMYFRPPLKYNSWPQNIAWIVLLWIAVICCIVSTGLLIRAISHDEMYMSCLNGSSSNVDDAAVEPAASDEDKSIPEEKVQLA
ncbi:hypothetical protein D9619_003940 [Psilocybe cf. subviscida]|uniref:Uncharacterized protein n=1 Tax=Psilocybe cf. subviscida TaxID=2480587 RepID=A0A8H5BNS4_9AGAR|nr:hypothetical protein D9619_003940 [Psilocybe cf. subviscida]